MLSLESLREVYCGKKVLVTGHTGFKGSWLVRVLYEIGAEVWGFSIDVPEDIRHVYYELRIAQIIQNPDSFQGDVSNYFALHSKLKEVTPDFVFHLAGQAIVSQSYEKPNQTFLTNTIGVLNLVEVLRNSKLAATTVIVTSDKCYSNNDSGLAFEEDDQLGGKDPYSASKACAEVIYSSYVSSFPTLSTYGIASARAGNVFGGGDWSKDRLIPDIMRDLTEGKDVELRMPEATRPWTYVLDVVWGYIQLAAHLKSKKIQSGQSWNFASGANLRVIELAKLIASNFSDTSKIVISKANVGEEAKLLQISPQKIMRSMGWSPLKTVHDQISETSDWYHAQNTQQEMVERSRKMILEYFES
jgi:CDP-glucose 4,6-dehydratase